MADVSLVCVREDAWKADLLAVALERYGFTVCRSASVFEDFTGYAAVVVLLSPGAARSDLVMGTAARALDWGKLIPVFVNLCQLPDRLSGVAMHDLAAWGGEAQDAVVKAIAFHAQRLAGLPGRPGFGPDRSPERAAALLQEQLPNPYGYAPQIQIGYDPQPQAFAVQNYPVQTYGEADYGARRYDGQGYGDERGMAPSYGHPQRYEPAPQQYAPQQYIEPPPHHPYDYEATHRRGFNQPRETYFVAAAHNEMDHYPTALPYAGHDPYRAHTQVAVSPNDASRRRAYFMDAQSPFSDAPRSTLDYSYDEPAAAPRQHRPMPGLFSVIVSAVALMSVAWIEEARTRELEVLRATPAQATAVLSSPASVDPAEVNPAELADAR